MKPQVLLHCWRGRLLTELLDQRLSPLENRRLEEHVARCSSCARNLAELRAVRDALHALRLKNEFDETPLLPWSAIEARLGEQPVPIPFLLRHRLPLAGAVCAVVLLALALVFYYSRSQPSLELAQSSPESSDLYQFVGDRLFTPEKVLMGESVVIGPEVEEAIFPERSYFHERSL